MIIEPYLKEEKKIVATYLVIDKKMWKVCHHHHCAVLNVHEAKDDDEVN